MTTLRHTLLAALLALSLDGAAAARDMAVPPSGILGITDAQLSPEFWVAQLPDANKVVLDTAAIATLNERVARLDPSMHDIRHLPASLPRDQVKGWIEKLTSRPSEGLVRRRWQVGHHRVDRRRHG